MNLALVQARKVLGNTKKNPAVGCVILKDNCLLSAASTSLNGYPHAEHNALIFNKKKNQNCDLYVTLEPCQMCAGALYWSQISRIVFAAKDEHRGYRVMGGKLHPKTKVTEGLLEKEASTLLKKFFLKKRNLN